MDHHVHQLHSFLVYQGPASGARSFLSSIVTAMITVTATVFSVSILVLQLANTQFSSRAIRMYVRDLTVQTTLGLFLATFVYAMVVQRSVGGADGFVPRISISVAFIFVLASVALFIRYISHISDLVRVATIVKTLAEESRRLLEQRYPPDVCSGAPAPPLPAGAAIIGAPRPGVVVSINERRLVEVASDFNCIVAFSVRVGDFLPADAPLCHVHHEGPRRAEEIDALEEKVIRAVGQDSERTMEQDLAFGFRQLVDIAEKALSPALNDPTTASQCLDSLHDLLRRLASRQLPDGRWYDDYHCLRVLVPQYSFEDYLEAALAEIWIYGRHGAQVRGRLLAMLADIETVARPENLGAILDWRTRICDEAHP